MDAPESDPTFSLEKAEEADIENLPSAVQAILVARLGRPNKRSRQSRHNVDCAPTLPSSFDIRELNTSFLLGNERHA